MGAPPGVCLAGSSPSARWGGVSAGVGGWWPSFCGGAPRARDRPFPLPGGSGRSPYSRDCWPSPWRRWSSPWRCHSSSGSRRSSPLLAFMSLLVLFVHCYGCAWSSSSSSSSISATRCSRGTERGGRLPWAPALALSPARGAGAISAPVLLPGACRLIAGCVLLSRARLCVQ